MELESQMDMRVGQQGVSAGGGARERMVMAAIRLVEEVDRGGELDWDPQVVALCRGIVEDKKEVRRATRDFLKVVADPQEVAGPRETVEERAQPHLDRMHEADRRIDLLGAELVRVVEGRVV